MRRWIQVTLALACIPLGLMLINYLRDGREKREAPAVSSAAPSEHAQNSVVSRVATEHLVQTRPEWERAERTTLNGAESASRASHALVRQPTQEVTRPDPTFTVPVAGIAANAAQPSDLSVGRPFPVSKSVVEACKPDKPGFQWSSCGRVNELLSEMAKEPRDETWAAAMEEVLRAYAEGEPENFTIRALECRKTICFIETASIFGTLTDPHFDFMRKHGLNWEFNPVFAHETDETGARLAITLMPFTRK